MLYKKLSSTILDDHVQSIRDEETKKSLTEFYENVKKLTICEKRGSQLYKKLSNSILLEEI